MPDSVRALTFLLVGLGLMMAACKESDAESPLLFENAIANYTRSVRTAIVQMHISEGIPYENMRFNRPEEFDTLDSADIGVFHPAGGGRLGKRISYQPAPSDFLAENADGQWLINAELAIPLLPGKAGSEGPGEVTDRLGEIVVYLPGFKKEYCGRVNEEWGIAGIPKLQSDQSAYYSKRMIDDGVADYVLPTGPQPYLDHPAFEGQIYGCFESFSGGSYVFFNVLIER